MTVEISRHHQDLSGVTLHYQTAGRGDPVVLLHGVPQSAHTWRHILPALTRRYAIIAPDLRGLGDSARPLSGYDKRTIANDVWELVHDKLGLKHFFLVGHDWGGPVAFALAAQHRDAVRGLAILDVTIPGDGAEMSQGGRRWHHPFFRTPDLPEALLAGREHVYLQWIFENYGYRSTAIPLADQQEYLRTYTKPGALRAVLSYYRAVAADAADNARWIAEGGRLQMPVLALGGDKSFGRGLETLESMKRMASDVRGGIVPNAGHWLAEEAPEFLADALLKFFAECGSAGR